VPIFTDPKEFKKHKEYVKLLKKALKKVKADTPKKFLYFKKYDFVPKKEPLVLVDYDAACQKAVIGEGLVITAKGNVTLTPDDKLDFQPKEGKIPRIKLQRYFKAMSPELKPIHIPQGEVDEDDDDDNESVEAVSKAPDEVASTGNKAMDRKMAFEEEAFKLTQYIDTLEQKPFPPEKQAQKDQALAMAKKFVAAGKHAEAKKLLTALAAQAVAADKAKAEPSSSPSGGNKAMDRKMAFEEEAFKLNQYIETLEQKPFPPEQQAKKDQALAMAKKFVAAGKHAEAKKLLTALAAQAVAAAKQPPGEDPAKVEIQKSLDALDEGYRQALKAVNYPTDDLRNAHDRVEARLKEGKIPEAQKALSDLRFELKRLKSQGAKRVRLAAANSSLKKGLSEARDQMMPQAGAAAAIEKQKLDAGKEFKGFLSALKAVEKDASENNLVSLQQAAQGYIDHYNAKHAGNKKRENDPKNLEKLRLSKEWVSKAKAMLGILKSEATLKANPGDEQAIEKARSEYGQAMIDAGLGGLNEGGGASDSYKIKDVAGKNAFVFKPQKGENQLPGMPPGAGMAREAIQSKIGDEIRDILGLDVPVARTTIVTANSEMFTQGDNNSDAEQVGALQEFLDSDGDAKARIMGGERKWMENIDQQSLESMAVLDIIMLNGDRKGDNMLVKDQPDGTTKLMPIDAGAGLPSKDTFENMASKTFFSPGFGNDVDIHASMYNLIPAASQPFSQETLDAIARLDPKEMRNKLAGHKQQMENDFPTTKGTIDDSTLDLSELSMRVLKRAAPQCSIVEINYIIATKLAALAKVPAVSDGQIDAAILDGKQKYVFIDAAQRKQFEATQLLGEVKTLGKEFQKKYPIGDQKRDGYDKLYMECENALYNQKVLLDWDKIVDDTPVKNVFDPLLVKLNQCKGILTAG